MFRPLPKIGSGHFFMLFFAQFVQFVYIEQTTNNKQTKPQTSGKHLLVICNCKNDITQDTPILRYNDLK